MKNKKVKKYSIIIGVILLLVVIVYFLLGKIGENSIKIQSNLALHKVEFTELSQKFLSQDIIRNIAFNRDYEIINGCSNHPDNTLGKWKCFKGGYYQYPNQEEIYFENLNEVLNYLKISTEEYTFYGNFLHRYGFDGIGQDSKNRFVELSSNLFGLRYYEMENSLDFIVDQEIQYIKKLDNHWFLFQRDWN